VGRARSLAAAQTVPVRGDVDANIAQHIRLIDAAAEHRPQVLVFPELSLTGYELDLATGLAFSETDARLRPLVDLATHYRMTFVVGAPVREQSVLYLGAFIIAPDGAIDLYTKHYLGAFAASDNPNGHVPPAESTVFQPGAQNPLIRLGDHTAAVAVCADVGRPAHARAAADRGADTYLASMFVIPSDLAKDTQRLESYAQQHRMAVVLANYGGPSGGLPSGGRSAIWSEEGELLTQLDATGSGIAFAMESDAGWRAGAIRL
jgi:predicted amidohydrolase